MNPWNDDDTWWHQQDLEMLEREEEERIEACNDALTKYTQETNDEPV